MLPKALLAAALASSTASALLLPSTFDAPPPGADHGHHRGHPGKNIEAAGGDEANINAVTLVFESIQVKVPCPGCAMQVRTRGRKQRHHRKHGQDNKEDEEKTAGSDAHDDDAKTDNGKIITITDIANHIDLLFTIAHGPDQDRLLVNGLELYPDIDVHGGALMAAQVPDRFDRRPHHPHHDEHHDEKEEGESELKMRLRRHRKGGPVEKENKPVEAKHRKGHKWHGEAKEGDALPPPPPHHGSFTPSTAFPGPHGKHGKHNEPLVKVPLGYSMQAKTVGQEPGSGMDVVSLTLQIIEVNNVFVQEIPAVNVHLIHTAEGGLVIARIDVGDEESKDDKAAGGRVGHHRHGSGKDRMASLKEELDKCSNLLCRWKTMISSMRSHHGGCAGKAMGKGGPKGGPGGGPHHHHGKKPGHSHGEHVPLPHHHHAHGLHLVKKFVSMVLFPVLIGVVAGIAASLIGMLVGSVVIGLWRMFFRRGQTGATHSSKAAVRHLDEQADDEEKAGLMAEDEVEPEVEAEAEAETEAEAEAETAPLMVVPPQAELPPYEDRDSKTSSA